MDTIIYLFEKQKDRAPLCCLSNVDKGWGWTQELRTEFSSPTWMKWTQRPERHCCLPGCLLLGRLSVEPRDSDVGH